MAAMLFSPVPGSDQKKFRVIVKIIDKITKAYSPLTSVTIDNWKKSIRVLNLKKGTRLVEEGEFSDKLYYIFKGSVKAYYFKDGKTITDWFAFDNDFICAITSYFSKEPSQHYIELTEDCILLEFKREDLQILAKKHHDFEHFIRVVITKIMLQLQQRIVSLQFTTAQQRYNYLLQNHPQIELRVALGDIASFLGIAQETLSRIRASK